VPQPEHRTATSSRVRAWTITTGPVASTATTTTLAKYGNNSNSSEAHDERIPAHQGFTRPLAGLILGYEILAGAT